MSIFMLIFICIITLLLCVYWRRKYNRITVMAERLGGPASYPIIGNANVFLGGDYLGGITTLTDECGDLGRFWMGPQVLITTKSPEVIEKILTSKAALDKGFFYDIMRPAFEDGLIAAKGNLWLNNRKIVAPAFSNLRVKTYVHIFGQGSEDLALKWKLKGGKKFSPFTESVQLFFQFPLITALGEDLFKEILGKKDLKTFALKLRLCSEYISARFFNPLLFMDWFYNLTPQSKVVKQEKMKLDSMLDTMISKKAESNDDDLTFLSYVIKAAKKTDKFGYNQIRDELKTYVVAGFETTATTINLALLMLGINPEVQEKVYAEQMEILQDIDRIPNFEDLNKMVYLEMVIKETLRIFPTIPMFSRELTADLPCGKKIIPKGATIVISPYVVHRLPEFYPKPLEFIPERFTPEVEKLRHPYAFLGFGGGSRACIGQKYAMLSMKQFMSSVVKRFRVHTHCGFDELNRTMTTAIELLVDKYELSLSERHTVLNNI